MFWNWIKRFEPNQSHHIDKHSYSEFENRKDDIRYAKIWSNDQPSSSHHTGERNLFWIRKQKWWHKICEDLIQLLGRFGIEIQIYHKHHHTLWWLLRIKSRLHLFRKKEKDEALEVDVLVVRGSGFEATMIWEGWGEMKVFVTS